jgi:hypothetical protein
MEIAQKHRHHCNKKYLPLSRKVTSEQQEMKPVLAELPFSFLN